MVWIVSQRRGYYRRLSGECIVSIAFSPLVHDLYWPSYHPRGCPSSVPATYPPPPTPYIIQSASQSINQLSRSPVQLVPQCSLQSWIHASSHLTWYRKSGLGEIMHGLTETLLPGGPRFARDDDGIHCNQCLASYGPEGKKDVEVPRSGELGVLAEPRRRLPRTHLSTLRALHGRRHLDELK